MSNKCPQCGFEEQWSYCPHCGAPLSETSAMGPSAAELHGPWTDKCPVCRAQPLRPVIEKSVLGGAKTTDMFKCDNCEAFFIPHDGKYKLTKVRDKATQTWRAYGNKSLTGEEWKHIAFGGVSDAQQQQARIMDMLADITKENTKP